MVATKPDSTRLVAFNLRGYSGSSSFPAGIENHEVGPIIGADFVNMVNYVIQVLGVLGAQNSILSIIAWSLAAASVIAGYGSLILPDGRIDHQDWTGYIKNIVFYEPAGSRGFGLPTWAADGPTLPPPPGDIGDFRRVAANYYSYDEDFYGRECPTGVHNPADTCTITGCLIESNHQAWVDLENGVLEPGPFHKYSRLRYSPTKQGWTEEETAMDFARRAMIVMAGTQVARIQGISTRNTLPGCTIGAQYLQAVITAAAPGKSLLTWIPDRHNHFVHNLAPRRLWTAIAEGN